MRTKVAMKIELSKDKPWKKWAGGGLLALATLYAAFAVTSSPTMTIASSEVTFETVSSGPLDLYSNVHGEFVSARERLLTAPALGKVAEIFVRPGTIVAADTIILTLYNPKLVQEVGQAKGQLAQLEAQRKAFSYEQQNERLSYQGRIADIEAEIEKAQLELSVNEELSVLGVVSKIELKRATLAVKQQNRRLAFEQEKYQQFTEMQGYQLTQRDITVAEQASQLALLVEQLENMQVKAGINGSLQNLEVELGQSVQLGESLAKVGSNEELIVRLRLPQNQADQIDINAPVVVDTQKGTITAHITRIESVVTKGVVLAEAVLDGPLTANARPSQAITAQVFIRHKTDAIFIRQIAGLRPATRQSVFVRAGNDLLVQRDVTLGDLSQQLLVITTGLSVGDVIVSSDTSKYSQYAQVSMTD
jgi:HlyD family secretion protein